MKRSTFGAVLVAGMAGPVSIYVAQPIAPLIAAELGIGAAASGLIIAAPTLALALASPFAGAVSDRIGRKPAMLAALGAMILPTLLASLATSLPMLIACQLLVGALIPGVSAVTLAYVGEEFPAERAPGVIAALISANIAGGFLGRFVSAMAAAHWGWAAAFRSIAALQLLALLLLLLFLPQSRNFRPTASPRAALTAMAGHVANPRLLGVFAVGSCTLFLIVGVFTYTGFRLMAAPYDLTVGQVGYLYGLYLLSMAINPLAGPAMRRFAPRRVLLGATLAVIAGLALMLAPALGAIVGGLALFTAAAFVSQSAASTQLMCEASTAKGAASGLYSSFYYVGGSLGATLPGFVWSAHGWPGAAALFAAVGLASAATAFLAWR